ncbi:hypothetical protein M434DRAFT_322527 [Hypoxylon sp. CO27-5]|nr:hypothetical protein M434DRAFT_322527 [Hypoxylon sp. CO27-5]
MVPSINSQATQAALLEMADSMLVQFLPDRDPELRAKKPENLFDGAVFSALLQVLDDEYNPSRFQQSLAASSTESDVSQGRRRNFHIIHMGLKDFARRSCAKIEPLIDQVDFQQLGREPTKGGIFDVLVLFVSAACFRDDDNEKYINLVMHLETKLQQGIFQVLKEVDAKLGQVTEAADGDLESSHGAEDDELAHEAALVQLQYEADERIPICGRRFSPNRTMPGTSTGNSLPSKSSSPTKSELYSKHEAISMRFRRLPKMPLRT